MRGRTLALVLVAMTSLAGVPGCAARQAQPAPPAPAATEAQQARNDPAFPRCIRKVKVVGSSFATGHDRAARKAHGWGTTYACPRGASVW